MENKLIRTKKSVLVKEASNGSSSRFYFETAEIEKYHKKRRRLI